MVWSAPIKAAAPTIGSAASCGRAPCAPLPTSSISKVSAAAASGPSCATTSPTANRRSTCAPKIAATPSRAPDSSTAFAPRPVSSAGWSKINTSPAAGRAASRCAAPTAQVAWTSCPQACITPGCSDAKGRPVLSEMGSASMSPRTATGAREPSRPRIRATTPVPATRSSRAGAGSIRANAAWSAAAVRSSLPDSSGYRCSVRRSSTSMRRNDWGNSSSTAFTRALRAAPSGSPPCRCPPAPPYPAYRAAPGPSPPGPWSTPG